MGKKIIAAIIIVSMIFSQSMYLAASSNLSEDVQIVANLGMLKGDGSGVTAEYVQTTPTRLQAAIMFLRLKGLENTALSFKGVSNFADYEDVPWSGGRALMAYLKAHPELGWQGDGINFYPQNTISAKEYYKVMLEALGYRQSREGVLGDFTWNNALDFAGSQGLGKSAYVTNFTIGELATATVETLKTNVKDENKTLITKLMDEDIIDAAKAALVSSNLVTLSVISGTVTSETSIVVNLKDNVSSKLAADESQYAVTIDSTSVKVTAVKYDEKTKKAVLTVNLKGKTGIVKVNGVVLNSTINLSSLKAVSISDINATTYNLYITLSEHPTVTLTGKKLLIVKDSLELAVTCTGVNGLEAVFEVDKLDRSKLTNGVYVVRVPNDDSWITIEGKTVIYPALSISSVSAISSNLKEFTITLSEYPIASLTGKKLILQKDGVTIGATYKSISSLKATFVIDTVDQTKLKDGIYVVSIPENDRWASITGKTTTYSATDTYITFSYAYYDINTGKLTLLGSGFKGVPGATNDITANKITIGNETSSYTLKSTSNVEIKSSNSAELMLSESDKAEVAGLLPQNGNDSGINGFHRISLEEGWNGQGSTEYINYTLYVTGHPYPAITSAAYDFSTGALTITGENLSKATGSNNDVNVSSLTIFAQGGKSYTLTSVTPSTDINEDTKVTIVVSGHDRAEINAILTKDGTQNESGLTYYLNASSGWNGYGTPQDINNPVTVSSYALPALTSADYDATTGVLTLKGTALRTVAGNYNDINSQKITISAQGGSSYTVSSGTAGYEVIDAFTAKISLSSTDRTNINGILDKNGNQNTLGQTYNISVEADWNGVGSPADLTGNTVIVSGYAVPYIIGASYNFANGVLTLNGYNFRAIAGTNNDITASSITISAGSKSYRLTAATSSVEITNANSAALTVAGIDRAELNAILTANGLNDASSNYYNIEVQADWNGIGSPADTTGNSVTVSNYTAPRITSAAYNFTSGQLTITGEYLRTVAGANNDLDASKIILSDGSKSYTLTGFTQSVDVSSSTTAAITVSNTDRAYLNWVFVANGLNNGAGGVYNIAVAADWNGTGSTADLYSNAVTVSNYTAPSITSTTYDRNTGILTIAGSYLRAVTGSTNDIDVTKLTISDGTTSRTLTGATANVEISSMTAVTLTIAGADKTAVDAILVQDGTDNGQGGIYNIAAALDWNGAGAAADLTGNSITVSNSPSPTATSATYNFSTGQLVLTGTNFKATTGAANDIIATAITLSDGTKTYTLTAATSDVEITSRTTAAITISGIDRAHANWIFLANGLNNGSGGVYNIALSANWNGTGTAEDLTANAITVSNYAAPTITSATYSESTGELVVTGTNLRAVIGADNDIEVTTLTFNIVGAGGTSVTFTLGETSNVDVDNDTQFTVTIAGADKATLDIAVDNVGTQDSGARPYNLDAIDGWNQAGSTTDAGNQITVLDIE